MSDAAAIVDTPNLRITRAGDRIRITVRGLEGPEQASPQGWGSSRSVRPAGFRPAFRDERTGDVYLSRFKDGTSAPMHVLAYLPAELLTDHGASNRPSTLQPFVTSGFVREGVFFDRDQAARVTARENYDSAA